MFMSDVTYQDYLISDAQGNILLKIENQDSAACTAKVTYEGTEYVTPSTPGIVEGNDPNLSNLQALFTNTQTLKGHVNEARESNETVAITPLYLRVTAGGTHALTVDSAVGFSDTGVINAHPFVPAS